MADVSKVTCKKKLNVNCWWKKQPYQTFPTTKDCLICAIQSPWRKALRQPPIAASRERIATGSKSQLVLTKLKYLQESLKRIHQSVLTSSTQTEVDVCNPSLKFVFCSIIISRTGFFESLTSCFSKHLKRPVLGTHNHRFSMIRGVHNFLTLTRPHIDRLKCHNLHQLRCVLRLPVTLVYVEGSNIFLNYFEKIECFFHNLNFKNIEHDELLLHQVNA